MAGDRHVARRLVRLTSGEGGSALLWLAALKKAGFKPTLYVYKSQNKDKYRLDFAGGDAVALATVTPAVGLNPKAEKVADMFREETGRGNVNVDVKLVDV